MIRKQPSDFRKNALELFLFLYLCTDFWTLKAAQTNRKYTRHHRLVLFTFLLIHFTSLSLIPEMCETCTHTHRDITFQIVVWFQCWAFLNSVLGRGELHGIQQWWTVTSRMKNENKLTCFIFSSFFGEILQSLAMENLVLENLAVKYCWFKNKFYPLKLKRESSLWVLCMVKALYLLGQGLSLNWWF